MNEHFAGTWKARSGTIYPILSKLKHKGFLDSVEKKSPIGPRVKLYFLTEAGEEIIKTKVNKNFEDQLRFIKNFLIELSSIYIQSFPEEKKEAVEIITIEAITTRYSKLCALTNEYSQKIHKKIIHRSTVGCLTLLFAGRSRHWGIPHLVLH